jgi:hypothetical protein
LQQAVAIAEKLIREKPGILDNVVLLASTYSRLARLENIRDNPRGVLAWSGKGLQTLQPIIDKEPRHTLARREFTDLRIGRAVALAQLGDHAQAAKDAGVIAKERDLTRVDVYNVACVYSRCAQAASKDANLPGAAARSQIGPQGGLAEQYADRAMDALRLSVAKGFSSIPALRTDPDLDPLRKREDFGKLLKELTESD